MRSEEPSGTPNSLLFTPHFLATEGSHTVIIDADGHTHVPNVGFDEYLDPAFRAERPRYVEFDDGRGVYIIEGRVVIKPSGWVPRHDAGASVRSVPVKSNSDVATDSRMIYVNQAFLSDAL